MRLEEFIAPLLYRHHCVVIPEFGAFLTQRKSAFYNDKSQSFYPPSKVISFNEHVKVSDGLLVSYVASVNECSYDQAVQLVQKEVALWKASLTKGTSIDLEQIGMLSTNEDKAVVFKPYNEVNYLKSSFGLASVAAAKKDTQTPVIALASTADRKVSKTIMRYAAVGLIAIASALTALQLNNNYKENTLYASQKAQEVVAKKIQEANFFSDNPIDLPALELEVVMPSPENHYFIIAGSFLAEENASIAIEALAKKGYTQASIIGQNAYGLHQVGIQGFAEETQARTFLEEVRSSGETAAWLLIK